MTNEICEQLDDLLLQQLSLYDQVQKLKEELQRHMRSGFFDLGKAKYSLGAHIVSPLSFDMRMKATKVLHYEDNKFTLGTVDISEKHASSGDSNENLRNRKKNNDQEGESKEEEELEEKKPKKVISAVDPLYWYSGFPPHTLRSSQASFNKALELITEIANYTQQMQQIENEYLKLKEQKTQKI